MLLTTVIGLFVFLGASVLASMLTLSSNWSSYKKTYDMLKRGEIIFHWCTPNDFYYFGTPENRASLTGFVRNRGKEVIFFEDGSIKLVGEGNYIHTSFYTYFDLYTVYWLRKLTRWFEANRKNFENENPTYK